MKKLIILTLSVFIFLGNMTACVKKETTTSETPVKKATDWKCIYAEFIPTIEQSEYESIHFIGINDLNFDGTPELLFSNKCASAAYIADIYYISDKKVKLLTSIEEGPDTYDEDDWITLRKNKNTGEMKYIIISSNGHSDGGYGTVYSFSDASAPTPVKEFEYTEITYDDSACEYYVSEKEVTKDEYYKAYDEFFKTWENTGFQNYAMTSEYTSYSKRIPISIDSEDLLNYFDKYQPEK